MATTIKYNISAINATPIIVEITNHVQDVRKLFIRGLLDYARLTKHFEATMQSTKTRTPGAITKAPNCMLAAFTGKPTNKCPTDITHPANANMPTTSMMNAFMTISFK